MEKSLKQIEKNVSASFSYVKKDMLMLNDAFSDIHEKIQHLSMNHATILGEIEKIKQELNKLSGKKTKLVVKNKVTKKSSKK